MPSVKELFAQYQKQGLAVLGISLDDDAQALQSAITDRTIPWPQLCDGKEGPLGKLFNAWGTPTFYVLNRQGRIAAKGESITKVKDTLLNLLKSASLSASDNQRKSAEILQAMGVRAGQVIADIGAGDGFFTRRFAEAVGPTGKAIGLDIDPAAIRAMMLDAQRSGLQQYEARLVPPDDPLLAPQSVDIVFLSDVLQHIENRVAYFTNLRGAFKPQGRLVIIDFGGSGEHAISKEETLTTMQKAGFTLVKEHDLLLPRQFFLEFAPRSQ